jgi:hydroxyacylglutathione hydrolase
VELIQESNLTVSHILITHGHFDHFLGAHELRDRLPNRDVEVLLHEKDQFLWDRVLEQCRDFGCPVPKVKVPPPTKYVNDKEVIGSGLTAATCIHTPGHTPGSQCIWFRDLNVMAAGDTLFNGGVGRTSWRGIPSLEGTSSASDLKESITNKLLSGSIPADVVVIAGHGANTTIGKEKARISYLF